jgi:outer membrane protein OmpA-like peptidoglycan-associated protein
MRLAIVLLFIGLFLGCSKRVSKIESLPDVGGFVSGNDAPVTVTQTPPVVQPPVIVPEQQRIAVPIADTVWFAFNSAVLRPEAKVVLDSIAKALTGAIVVSGYASPEGQPEYNQILSQQRADAVRDELGKFMTGFVDIQAVGKGMLDAAQKSEYPQKRRVEIFTEGK